MGGGGGGGGINNTGPYNMQYGRGEAVKTFRSVCSVCKMKGFCKENKRYCISEGGELEIQA